MVCNALILPLRLLPALIVAFAAAAGDAAARAGASRDIERPAIDDIRAGFAGRYKVGYWTPVRAVVAAGGAPVAGRLEVLAPDGDGATVRMATGSPAQLSLAAGERREVVLYAKTGRLRSRFRVELRDATGAVVARGAAGGDRAAMLATDDLIVVLGGDIGLEEAVRLRRRWAKGATEVARVASPHLLPDRWWGYEGVDTVVLAGGGEPFAHAWSAAPAQRDALDQWVQMGGQLIICVGRAADELLAAGKPWAPLLPGVFRGTTELRDTAALETYAGGDRLDLARPGEVFRLLLARIEPTHGRIEVAAGREADAAPVILRASHGFGEVVFAGIDLDAEPVASWNGRPRLVARLLDRAASSDAATEGSGDRLGQAAHEGYADLTGQLRAALEQFPAVRLVPFSIVAALALVYIVLIGPVDYFLLRRWIGRMEWTWATFPLVIVLFCLGAWAAARWARGDRVRLNQAEIVDVDLASGRVRGTVWSNLFSPHSATYDLELRPQPPVDLRLPAGTLLSWQGLPGTGFGGMHAPLAVDAVGTPYRLVRRSGADAAAAPHVHPSVFDASGEEVLVQALPIQAGATKTLAGRWWGVAEPPPFPPLQTNAVGLLRGEIVNPLSVDLDGCVLMHDRWAYLIGRMRAGATRRIDETVAPRNLESLLRRRQVRELSEVATPWDRASHDVGQIVQMMMVHEAAGGRGYTGLDGQYQAFVDLSRRIKLDRAVLVGQCAAPAATLQSDGTAVDGDQKRHWTFGRLVFPVTIGSEAR